MRFGFDILFTLKKISRLRKTLSYFLTLNVLYSFFPVLILTLSTSVFSNFAKFASFIDAIAELNLLFEVHNATLFSLVLLFSVKRLFEGKKRIGVLKEKEKGVGKRRTFEFVVVNESFR